MTEETVGVVYLGRSAFFAPSRAASNALVPAFLLALALIYPLFITQLISGTFLHSPKFDAQSNVEAASNTVNRAFWLVLFSACLVAAAIRRMAFLAHAAALWPLLLYLAWSTATLDWAVDRHIAVRQLVLQLCIVGSIWLPIAMLDSVTWVRRLALYALLGVLLLNAAAAFAIARTQLGYAGLFDQKNELGAVAALGLLTFTMTFFAKSNMDRIAALIGLPVAAFLLVYSQSRTSFILSAAVPMLTFGIICASWAIRIRSGFIIASGIAFTLLASSVAFGAGFGYRDLLKLFYHDATFTGGNEIWSSASHIMTRPFTGFGFNGFWGVGGRSAADNAFIANILQSHNGYLDTLLADGFVGLGILVCFIVATLGYCGRLLRNDIAGGAFCLAIALFFTLHNFEESSAFRGFEPAWILFLVAAIAVARPPRRRTNAAWQMG